MQHFLKGRAVALTEGAIFQRLQHLIELMIFLTPLRRSIAVSL